MRLEPIYMGIAVILTLLTGCYPKTNGVDELYERQALLEAKIDKLSEDLESGILAVDRDIDRVETNQLKLAEEIQNLKMENAALKRSINKMAGKKTKPTDTPRQTETSRSTAEYIYSRALESYNEGRFEDAILEYQILIDTYPKDKRIPEAYLKQGLALINLGRKKEARFFLNALIDKYPNSREAETAKEKLKTI